MRHHGGECVTTTKLTGPVLPGMSVPAAELFPRATMEDQHLLSDQRGRTRTRVVALGLAAVACGLVAAVAVTGSKAVSLMQYQIVNIPRSSMLNFKEGFLGDYPNEYEDPSKLAGYLDQYPNEYLDPSKLAGFLDQYPNEYEDPAKLAGYLDQYPNEYEDPAKLAGYLDQYPNDYADPAKLAGYLDQYPNDYEGGKNLGGYLAQFPEDTSAATCGQGACDDENGCDDQAFLNCLHQLREMRAVSGPLLVQMRGGSPYSSCGAVACSAQEGCDNRVYFQCAAMKRQEKMVRAVRRY